MTLFTVIITPEKEQIEYEIEANTEEDAIEEAQNKFSSEYPSYWVWEIEVYK